MRKLLTILLSLMLLFNSSFTVNVMADDEQNNDTEITENTNLNEDESHTEDNPVILNTDENQSLEDINQEKISEENEEYNTPSRSSLTNETTPNRSSTILETGSCGDNATYTIYDDYSMVISGTGSMNDYSSSNRMTALYGQIESITIEHGITSIGERAFDEFSTLKSITISDSVASLGQYCLHACSSLTSLSIPNSVTTLPRDAFSYCTSLSSVTIPDSVTTLERGVFYGCSSLETIDLPSSVTSIGQWCFSDNSSLSSFSFPEGVTAIDQGTFRNCTGLQSIYVPGTVVSIYGSNVNNSPFYGCSSSLIIYTEVAFKPSSWDTYWNYYSDKPLTTVYNYNPNSLDTFPITGSCGTNVTYTIYDDYSMVISGTGPTYEYAKGSKITYLYNSVKNVVIEDGVTTIGSGLFYTWPSIISVTVPNSVVSIGNYAFSGCTSLSSINIPDSVTSIEYDAFCNCKSLSIVFIPSSVTTIKGAKYYDSPFFMCSPDLIVFTNASSKLSGWESCWNYYDDGKSLKVVYNCESVSDCSFPVTGSCGTNATYTIYDDYSMVISGSGAMNDYSNSVLLTPLAYVVKSITIEEGITTIGDYAFDKFGSLTSIILPETINTIGRCSFRNCPSLSTINIPTSVKTIKDWAFEGCSSLISLSIPDSVTSIGNGAFAVCTSLETVVLPNTISSLGYDLFKNSTGLLSLSIPDSVTSINYNAFYGCSSLKELYIPSTVTTISAVSSGKSPFYLCSENLVLYTDASSQLSGWGNYWNYYDGSNELQVVYGLQDLSRIGERHTVIWKNYDGSVLERDEMVPYGATPKYNGLTPEKQGDNHHVFVFSKWSPDVSPVDCDIEYTAEFERLELYSITYNANGGTGAPNTQIKQENRSINLSNTVPRKTDYTFFAWNTLISNNIYEPGSVYDENSDITLYAMWCEHCHDCDGVGKVETSSECPDCSGKGTITTTTTTTCSTCSGSGKVTTGQTWINCSSCNGRGKITSTVVCSTCHGVGGSALCECSCGYRWWYVNTEGGSQTLSRQCSRCGRTVTATVYGSCSKCNGSGSVTSSVNCSACGGSGGRYIYSLASCSRCNGSGKLTQYNTSGCTKCNGSGEIISQVVCPTCNGDTLIYPNAPSCESVGVNRIVLTNKAGYEYSLDKTNWQDSNVFDGLEPDCTYYFYQRTAATETVPFGVTSEALSVTTPSLSSSYNISYDLNGGNNNVNNPSEYSYLDAVSLLDPVREGYSFIGWVDENGNTVSSIPVHSTGDKTFIANWLVNQYTIAFNTDGGTEIPSITQDYGTAITAPADPEKVDFIFEGWDCEIPSVMPAYNITVNAIWMHQGNSIIVSPSIADIGEKIYIDGQPAIININNGAEIGDNSKVATTYTIANSANADIHTQYPTSMKVYLIQEDNQGNKSLVHFDDLDNILTYAGASIRITGNKGIRTITSIPTAKKNQLINSDIGGYKVMEYGTLMCWASSLATGQEPTMDLVGHGVVKGRAYDRVNNINAVYSEANGTTKYTNTLVGNYTDAQCASDFAMRSYIVLRPVSATDNSEDIVLYGGTLYRSISYVALQNKNAFKKGSSGYEYIWGLIRAAYPDVYDAEYQRGN